MREALHAKKKVVLVHEMDASRGGVEEFGYFFGVTPQELKDLGLYAEPAIAMKAAPYRSAARAKCPGLQRPTRPHLP